MMPTIFPMVSPILSYIPPEYVVIITLSIDISWNSQNMPKEKVISAVRNRTDLFPELHPVNRIMVRIQVNIKSPRANPLTVWAILS